MTARVILALALLSTFSAQAIVDQRKQPQIDMERDSEAVVRNKSFFKKGKFELAVTGGMMPYDSVIDHKTVGGRVTWHFSDHYGWEILDAQFAFSSITTFTTDLVSGKGLSNLQVTELKTVLGTSLHFAPIYGKFRLFGATVMYFDIYGVVGAGFANTNDLMFSTTNTGGAVAQSTVKSAWDPMITAGLGMKVFATNSFGFLIDLRDYMTLSETYGKRGLKNNFQVCLGLCMFLPGF